MKNLKNILAAMTLVAVLMVSNTFAGVDDGCGIANPATNTNVVAVDDGCGITARIAEIIVIVLQVLP